MALEGIKTQGVYNANRANYSSGGGGTSDDALIAAILAGLSSGGGGGGGYQMGYGDTEAGFSQMLGLRERELNASIESSRQRLEEIRLQEEAAGGRLTQQLASERQNLLDRLSLDREQLGETQRQFNEELAWGKERFGKEFGLSEREIALQELLGTSKVGLDERSMALQELTGQRSYEIDLKQLGIQEKQAAIQARAVELEAQVAQGRLKVDEARLRLEKEIETGKLQLGREQLALEAELGRGKLGIEKERLGLDTRRFGLEEELGRAAEKRQTAALFTEQFGKDPLRQAMLALKMQGGVTPQESQFRQYGMGTGGGLVGDMASASTGDARAAMPPPGGAPPPVIAGGANQPPVAIQPAPGGGDSAGYKRLLLEGTGRTVGAAAGGTYSLTPAASFAPQDMGRMRPWNIGDAQKAAKAGNPGLAQAIAQYLSRQGPDPRTMPEFGLMQSDTGPFPGGGGLPFRPRGQPVDPDMGISGSTPEETMAFWNQGWRPGQPLPPGAGRPPQRIQDAWGRGQEIGWSPQGDATWNNALEQRQLQQQALNQQMMEMADRYGGQIPPEQLARFREQAQQQQRQWSEWKQGYGQQLGLRPGAEGPYTQGPESLAGGPLGNMTNRPYGLSAGIPPDRLAEIQAAIESGDLSGLGLQQEVGTPPAGNRWQQAQARTEPVYAEGFVPAYKRTQKQRPKAAKGTVRSRSAADDEMDNEVGWWQRARAAQRARVPMIDNTTGQPVGRVVAGEAPWPEVVQTGPSGVDVTPISQEAADKMLARGYARGAATGGSYGLKPPKAGMVKATIGGKVIWYDPKKGMPKQGVAKGVATQPKPAPAPVAAPVQPPKPVVQPKPETSVADTSAMALERALGLNRGQISIDPTTGVSGLPTAEKAAYNYMMSGYPVQDLITSAYGVGGVSGGIDPREFQRRILDVTPRGALTY